jgi:hypothetical protein
MTKRWLGIGGAAAVAVAVVAGMAVASASCAQTPTNVPVHSLQQSQKIDVVCLHLIEDDGGFIQPPRVAPLTACAPVAANVTGGTLPYHLFAMLTQTTRGELAVVDLTAGLVVDEDRSMPGVNFIPVGASPTDVVVAPDGLMTFVSSAAPNTPAIYGIPNHKLLGDYAGAAGLTNTPPLRLTDLEACSLDQPPQALAVASRSDGGYAILAMLRASARYPDARIVAIDPAPLTVSGISNEVDAQVPDGGASAALPSGTLAPCHLLGGTTLANGLPASWSPGTTWPDGVPYADAGVGAAASVDAGDAGFALSFGGQLDPPHPTSMIMRDDAHLLYVADESIPVIHVIDVSDPTSPVEQAPLLATSLLNPQRQVSVGALAMSPATRDFKRYLYAVDTRAGSIMVYDVTDPATSARTPMRRPHPELNPFLEPDRIVFGAPVAAVTFVQHDWPIPSQQEMPMMHFYTGALCNPNQNAHPDAGTFNDIGAYYRVDQAPVIQSAGTVAATVASFPYRLRGVFAFVMLTDGTIDVIDVDDWDAPCRRPDPMSIEPVSDIAGVGVDAGLGQTGVLDLPQPPPGNDPDAGKYDPYHTPLAYNSVLGDSPAVTLEPFFPVVAPHRLRSSSILLNDPSVGSHMPYLPGTPQQFDVSGALVSTSGPDAITKTFLLPTRLPPNWIDPSYVANPLEPNPSLRVYVSPDFASPGQPCSPPATLMPGTGCTFPPAVRFSFDDPTVHQSLDWTVTYEGVLPSATDVLADIGIDPKADADHQYETLRLSATGVGFCRRGIEDRDVAAARANQVLTELERVGLPEPQSNPPLVSLPQWTGDYVEIIDDILPQTDGYWSVASVDGGMANDCWDGQLADSSDPNIASKRFSFCSQTFGQYGSDADTHLLRDMPILEAHDDFLVVGRFGWFPTDPSGAAILESTTNRFAVGDGDPTNKPFLRAAKCCFHNQAAFKVRAGGEWLTVGNIGMLHHIRSDPESDTKRCIVWNDPRQQLLNARAFEVPWSTTAENCVPRVNSQPIERDSPLAMRNPMFSFVMWSGCNPPVATEAGVPLTGYLDHTTTQRDQVWKFSVRGGYGPISLSVATGSTAFVSPQSMRFIPPLGQIAIVDAAQQGLSLLDLNTLGLAANTPIY